MKFAFIQAQKAQFPVEMMCSHLGVSRSGYYASCHRRPSRHQQQDEQLADKIHVIHQHSRGTYGRPRVHAVLRSQGIQTSAKRVHRLMKHKGLQARLPRRYRSTTDSGHALPVAPNVLARAFWAQAPNQAWVGGITFIPTAQGWLYLAVLLDLFSHRVVGWAMGESIDQDLCLSALQMALQTRQPPPGLVHHSDRGSQHASGDYQAALLTFGLTGSKSRKGNCWDNAVAESLFATLKTELCQDRRFATRAEARAAKEKKGRGGAGHGASSAVRPADGTEGTRKLPGIARPDLPSRIGLDPQTCPQPSPTPRGQNQTAFSSGGDGLADIVISVFSTEISENSALQNACGTV